jgi:hypothetical protein
LLASIIGNMIPIIPLLFLLKNERLKWVLIKNEYIFVVVLVV